MNLHDQPPPDVSPEPETPPSASHPPPLVAPKPDEGGLVAPKSAEAGLVAPKSDEGGSTPTPEPDWALLLQQTQRFAEVETHGYCWREVSEGVLPSGYDASSVAAEAVEEVFREVEVGSLAPNPKELKRALRRCARKIINRLHHRMENEVMVSECDLYPIFKDYGEVIGALEMFPGQEPDPAEVLMAKEDAAEFEHLKQQFEAMLDRDKLLKDMFGCICAGIIKREAIARKLGLPVNAIKNAQERLNRQVAEFKKRKKV